MCQNILFLIALEPLKNVKSTFSLFIQKQVDLVNLASRVFCQPLSLYVIILIKVRLL